MTDELLKILKEGGGLAVALFCSLVANVAQWRKSEKGDKDLLELNEKQHEAQLDAVKILTKIDVKTDRCPRQYVEHRPISGGG